MKPHLMFKERDFRIDAQISEQNQKLIKDLELEVLFNALSSGDEFLYRVVRQACLSNLTTVEEIRYRQHILTDAINYPNVIKQMYRLTVECIEMEKKTLSFNLFSNYPSSVLHSAVNVLKFFFENLVLLREMAERYTSEFESEGFLRFFSMLSQELSDEYLAEVSHQLRLLRFNQGVLISARLGPGNVGQDYILRSYPADQRSWLRRLLAPKAPAFTVKIAPRDENGAQALSDLENRGLVLVANALSQSTSHIRNFFTALRTELGFYVSCLNLYDALSNAHIPLQLPALRPAGERFLSYSNLYDVCLAIRLAARTVPNSLPDARKNTFIITGANQGGKSTFLRSIGGAYIMAQCGMFVCADQFCTDLVSRIYTHYRHEEDTTMASGKLDEELDRMNIIVDQLKANDLILFNESFAATNSREGSAIARDLTLALSARRIKIFFVTHLSEFACRLYQESTPDMMFLSAERGDDGKRTYKITEGEPFDSSYGEDLYNAIFINEH
jgi:hypothetical protein